jgi:2-oxoisovalerate dehydrogenase E1 component beta subunit
MTTLTLSKALNAGLRKAMENDPKVLIMGEDVGKLGGVFRVTDGLQKDFGEARVIDTPLAESAIVGTAIGLALRGYRPVCEIQFDGFVYPAADQIISQLAKMRYRSLGHVSLPVVIRIPCGGGIGAVEHHSESPEAIFAHTAGLRVVACADAADAFAMIQQSISSDDPVIFFEPKRRYWDKGEVDTVAGVASALPLDRAKVVLEGTDVTLLTYGPVVRTALESALAAREDGPREDGPRDHGPRDHGRSVEVVDLRSLSPIDVDTICASVRKTGRCVVAHEAPVYAGLGAEIAARVTEQCFYQLEAPVLRVGGFATPYPPSRLEDHYLPDLDRILDAVDRTFGY